jgi:3-phosphoinositide dependent protein kinase-1
MSSKSANEKLSLQDFHVIKTIGEGTYSLVQQVETIKEPKVQYAMKVVDKQFLARYQKQHVVLNEKRALLSCNHPSIIHLYHTFRDDDSLFFILELAEAGDVADDIKCCGKYSLDRARYYAGALFAALHYLHFSAGIIHYDVKPENLLLNCAGRLKLADFGSCCFLHDIEPVSNKRSNFVGTASYAPPELLTEQSKPGIGADWWAAGCVLYQMLTGKPAYTGTSEYLIFQSILNDKLVFPQGFDPSAQDLINRLMNRDPLHRLGVQESDWQIIKSHPFFHGLDIETIHLSEPPPHIDNDDKLTMSKLTLCDRVTAIMKAIVHPCQSEG